ncbi:MAG: hypothetical protein V4510_09845 [bacterium]
MSTAASREAYQQQLPMMRNKRGVVFDTIRQQGRVGQTIREVMAAQEWPHTTVSARIFELAEAGVICPRGDTRDGQTVWIVTPPEQVDFWREKRAAKKRGVQAKIVAFEGVGGPAAFSPIQIMRVTVEMTRAEWAALKNIKTARFA